VASDEELKACQACQATVYPEHIKRGQAGYWAGQLLCSVCLAEKKSEAKTAADSAPNDDKDTLELVDEGELKQSGRKVITAFGSETAVGNAAIDDSAMTRPLNKTGQGATRIRVFHTRLNDGAAAFMAQSINQWADSDPDIEVKHSATTVGVWEGKHPEPHLIITVWY